MSTAPSEEALNEAIQAWINLQTESSLKEATVKTVKKVLLTQFSVNSFTREQKDFIKSATITALVKRTKEIDEESKKEESKKKEMKNLLVDGVAVINTQDASNTSRCWRCSEEICIQCGASAHHDSNCADAHEATLDGVATSEGWVRCTKCRLLIERVNGCDHMTCRCGAEFCFQCGTMPHCGFTCKKKKNLDDEA